MATDMKHGILKRNSNLKCDRNLCKNQQVMNASESKDAATQIRVATDNVHVTTEVYSNTNLPSCEEVQQKAGERLPDFCNGKFIILRATRSKAMNTEDSLNFTEPCFTLECILPPIRFRRRPNCCGKPLEVSEMKKPPEDGQSPCEAAGIECVPAGVTDVQTDPPICNEKCPNRSLYRSQQTDGALTRTAKPEEHGDNVPITKSMMAVAVTMKELDGDTVYSKGAALMVNRVEKKPAWIQGAEEGIGEYCHQSTSTAKIRAAMVTDEKTGTDMNEVEYRSVDVGEGEIHAHTMTEETKMEIIEYEKTSSMIRNAYTEITETTMQQSRNFKTADANVGDSDVGTRHRAKKKKEKRGKGKKGKEKEGKATEGQKGSGVKESKSGEAGDADAEKSLAKPKDAKGKREADSSGPLDITARAPRIPIWLKYDIGTITSDRNVVHVDRPRRSCKAVCKRMSESCCRSAPICDSVNSCCSGCVLPTHSSRMHCEIVRNPAKSCCSITARPVCDVSLERCNLYRSCIDSRTCCNEEPRWRESMKCCSRSSKSNPAFGSFHETFSHPSCRINNIQRQSISGQAVGNCPRNNTCNQYYLNFYKPINTTRRYSLCGSGYNPPNLSYCTSRNQIACQAPAAYCYTYNTCC